MKKANRIFSFFAGSLSLIIGTTLPAKAQDFEISEASSSDWSELSGGIFSMASSLAELIEVAIIIGGLAVLTMLILKLMKGDKESATKLLWWLVGLSFGLGMLVFITKDA